MPIKLKSLLILLAFLLAGSFIFFGRSITRAATSGSSAVSAEVAELNRQIEEKKASLKTIQNRQAAYSGAIKQKQGEQASLKNQLAIIENRTEKAELDISETQTEIDRTGLEIEKTGLEIKDKENSIAVKKDHVANILRMVYKKDDTSYLEVLLLNNSFSEFLNQAKYLEDVNSEIKDTIEELKTDRENLEKQKTELDAKGKDLEKQKSKLQERQDALAVEYQSKNILLDQTRSSEAEYQKLLKQAKNEQAAAAADISGLEFTVRKRLSESDEKKLENNPAGLVWPVPKNTITSSFHDPDYPFRYIFEHPAVDIRAGQGTPIKAASSGYVARAKDAGMGYSYIMLIHGDGLSTVYGHVSRIYVKEDEYVAQGQVIGASGGMPGTPGAGPLTTGPHLHFEVRSNGMPVNPLEYLP